MKYYDIDNIKGLILIYEEYKNFIIAYLKCNQVFWHTPKHILNEYGFIIFVNAFNTYNYFLNCDFKTYLKRQIRLFIYKESRKYYDDNKYKNLMENIIMNGVEKRAANSMNYFLLRDIYKDEYPESVKEELSFYLEGLCITLEQKDEEIIQYLQACIRQELEEGDYTNNVEEFPNMLKEYCLKNVDLDDSQIMQICTFYKNICDDIEKDLQEIDK